MASVLLIEDEADLVDVLRYNLEREELEVRAALTGAEGLSGARSAAPDLIVLDIMLPDMSGLDVCRALRREQSTAGLPVLMLTARGSEGDRVAGFEAGADDYLTKPFSVREFVLRVKAILRRTQPEEESQRKRFGVLELDEDAHQVWVGGAEVTLTPLEFKLLSTFMDRRGRVQSRNVLLADVWGLNGDLSTRTVDTHVKRLRQRLGDAGGYIETLRGVGYRFRASPD